MRSGLLHKSEKRMLEESPALEVKCSRRDEHYWIITFAIVSAKEKNDGMAAGGAGRYEHAERWKMAVKSGEQWGSSMRTIAALDYQRYEEPFLLSGLDEKSMYAKECQALCIRDATLLPNVWQKS